jgi:hypothetical protein
MTVRVCNIVFSSEYLVVPSDYPKQYLAVSSDYPKQYLAVPSDYPKQYVMIDFIPDYTTCFHSLFLWSSFYLTVTVGHFPPLV